MTAFPFPDSSLRHLFRKRARAANRGLRAFTLVELLVVMGILIILLALVVTSSRGISNGHNLTSAGAIVAAHLEGARQLAAARNVAVELRFYKYRDNTSVGSEEQFQAMQLFSVGPYGDLKPEGKMEKLPEFMRLSTSEIFSSLLDPDLNPERSAVPEDLPIQVSASAADGSDNRNYKYVSVRFRADGSSPLDPNLLWFVTVEDSRDTQDPEEEDEAPRKSVTIQIDPVNGVVRSMRPG